MTPSLRRRLLVSLLSVVALSGLLTALAAYLDARHEIEELFDAQLAQSARVLLAMSEHELAEARLYQGRSEAMEIPYTQSLHNGHEYERKLAFQVWLDGTRLILHSANTPLQPLSNQRAGFSEHVIAQQPWRVFSLSSDNNEIRVQVAQSLEIRGELIAAISLRLLTPLLLSLPLLAILIWYGVSRAMRPMLRLVSSVEKLKPDQLEPLPLGDIPAEIRPLVMSLNQLFGRLQQAFENERRFTADAAHELRTPLAALKTQAQVALQATDGDTRHHALQQVVHGVDRATHLLQQLLTLARLDPDNADRDATSIALCAICRETLADFASEAHGKHIELSLNDACQGHIRGNRDAIYILLRNLIDNAIRYTPPGGTVAVEVCDDGQSISLSVSDSGPGIPPQERQQVLKRFYRTNATRESGSGLGLSIVQRIIERHGASLSLETSALGGLKVSIHFPHA